jgi:hypothetical protein
MPASALGCSACRSAPAHWAECSGRPPLRLRAAPTGRRSSTRSCAREAQGRCGPGQRRRRATAGAVYLAATRLRGRLARIAAAQLNLRPKDLRFAGGRIFAASNPENSLSFARVAAAYHWSPTVSPTPNRPRCGKPCFGALRCSSGHVAAGQWLALPSRLGHRARARQILDYGPGG